MAWTVSVCLRLLQGRCPPLRVICIFCSGFDMGLFFEQQVFRLLLLQVTCALVSH